MSATHIQDASELPSTTMTEKITKLPRAREIESKVLVKSDGLSLHNTRISRVIVVIGNDDFGSQASGKYKRGVLSMIIELAIRKLLFMEAVSNVCMDRRKKQQYGTVKKAKGDIAVQ